jgi:hypothetical protein
MKLSWILAALIAAGCASSQTKPASRPEEIKAIAQQAYLFGFPMMVMETTRDVDTAVASPTEDLRGLNRAPVNQFAHVRAAGDEKTVDQAFPTSETLLSYAWLDLSKQAIVLSLPDAGNRYYQFSLWDGWGNVFFAPSSRTTGDKRRSFAIVGPQWKGQTPEGTERIQAPTNIVRVMGRTSLRGPNDYGGARYVQDRYELTPLDQWGTGYTPPKEVAVNNAVDARTEPTAQVLSLSGLDYFKQLAELMKKNPPLPEDAEEMNQLARIGLLRGRSLDASQLSQEAITAINEGALAAQEQLRNLAGKPLGEVDGAWVYHRRLGVYGKDYARRAALVLKKLTADLDADLLVVTATKDETGKDLEGKSRYVLHFGKDDLHPAKSFWALSLYGADQHLVKNPLRRFAVRDRDKLLLNRDGSLDIFIQNKSPGGKKAANWLPAPVGNFSLMMRLYWPADAALEGSWKMPRLQRVGAPTRLPKTAQVE